MPRAGRMLRPAHRPDPWPDHRRGAAAGCIPRAVAASLCLLCAGACAPGAVQGAGQGGGPLPPPVTYDCAGTTAHVAFLPGDRVRLTVDGATVVLPQAISADGARYVDPAGGDLYWSKGRAAMIATGGRDLADCRQRDRRRQRRL